MERQPYPKNAKIITALFNLFSITATSSMRGPRTGTQKQLAFWDRWQEPSIKQNQLLKWITLITG